MAIPLPPLNLSLASSAQSGVDLSSIKGFNFGSYSTGSGSQTVTSAPSQSVDDRAGVEAIGGSSSGGVGLGASGAAGLSENTLLIAVALVSAALLVGGMRGRR